MVLRWRRRGRVGSCRKSKARDVSRAFFYALNYEKQSQLFVLFIDRVLGY